MVATCGTEVVIIDYEQLVGVYDSSEWAERGFCKNCGSNLFYRIKESNQYHLPLGLFEEEDSLNFNSQIFIDEKPQYYNFANTTKNMTGPEVFAAYSGE